MVVVGICMVKDEADIIKITVEHMLTQVDHVVVADNGSIDGTKDILASLPITLIDDPDPAYYQSKKMTDLAKVAGNLGADWVVPFDADEIWYSTFGTIKEILSGIPVGLLIAKADMYDHVTSSEDSLFEPNPIKRIGWRRTYKGAMPKVACRWKDGLEVQQGNHSAKYDDIDVSHHAEESVLVIRHFPYRSPEQFVSKVRNGAAAYAATDLPESAGAHWRGYGRILEIEGEEALINNVYKTWFHLNDPRKLEDVIFNPASLIVY